jgi:hypothetical protein
MQSIRPIQVRGVIACPLLSGLFVLFGLMRTAINDPSLNCEKKPHQEDITHEIACLLQLHRALIKAHLSLHNASGKRGGKRRLAMGEGEDWLCYNDYASLLASLMPHFGIDGLFKKGITKSPSQWVKLIVFVDRFHSCCLLSVTKSRTEFSLTHFYT